MPSGSFKKLSIPPRLNDRLLDPLSIRDHVKYLNFHNHYRALLERIQSRGASRDALQRFGLSVDWLRVVDHLMRRWTPEWAFAYIRHTFPAFEWPDDRTRGTVDPLTFGFLWFLGVTDGNRLGSLQCLPADAFRCPVCGKFVDVRATVLRCGLPTCGCEKRILRPVSASTIVSNDFSQPALVDAFRLRCRDQRVIDLQEAGDLTFVFTDHRIGRPESAVRESLAAGRPTFIVGPIHASYQRAEGFVDDRAERQELGVQRGHDPVGRSGRVARNRPARGRKGRA